MNKFLLLGSIIIGLTTSCSNSSQSNNNDNSTNQILTTSDTFKTNKNMITQKITPSLWIETTDAKAAADYYLSIFKDGKLKDHRKYKNPPEAGGGDFETAIIEINGVEFNILAAGPFFKFNESVSFVINCKDQAEVDYYWNALTANGGQESSCGWCKDKYGLSWQVVPLEYFDLINSDDPKVRDKAMKNTLKQKKIILSELK
ncbi:MAG: VOC family protein [Chitinophagales bacterium]|nr:VOC family protein [Chitinophagales bacterium]